MAGSAAVGHWQLSIPLVSIPQSTIAKPTIVNSSIHPIITLQSPIDND
jgi:hypothetical protein